MAAVRTWCAEHRARDEPGPIHVGDRRPAVPFDRRADGPVRGRAERPPDTRSPDTRSANAGCADTRSADTGWTDAGSADARSGDRSGERSPPATGPAGALVRSPDPVQALRALQSVRSQAYAASRPDLLGQVYPAGSALLAEDLATYRRLTGSGRRVVGLAFGITEPRIRPSTPTQADLLVTVRQAPAVLVETDGTRSPLPARELGRFRVVLTRTTATGGWRIAVSTPVDAAGSP